MPVKYIYILRSWVELRLRTLDSYARQMEEFIEDARDRVYSELNERAIALSEAAREEFWEDQHDVGWELRELFPSILRRSFFVYCYSFLDSSLLRVRQGYEVKTGGSLMTRISNIAESRQYLESLGVRFPSSDWPRLHGDYRQVRNTITHEGGLAPHDPHEKMEIENRLIRLGHAKIEQHEIVLEAEFISEFVEVLNHFFEELWCALEACARTNT
jgi:hypothetical protein